MNDDDLLFSDPDAVIPGIRWWQGPVECGICGYGTSRHSRVTTAISVMPIPEGQAQPVVPMECPDCGGMTVAPACEPTENP